MRVVDLVLDLLSGFYFKQKTAYEVRISDWSSDVCSSDLARLPLVRMQVMRSRQSSRTYSGHCAAAPRIDRHPRPMAVIPANAGIQCGQGDRKSVVEGKSVSVRVDLGGRRIINKKHITSEQ